MAARIVAFYRNFEPAPRISYCLAPVIPFDAWKHRRRKTVKPKSVLRIEFTPESIAELAPHGTLTSKNGTYLHYRLTGTGAAFTLTVYGLDWSADIRGTADGLTCPCGRETLTIAWRPGAGILCPCRPAKAVQR